MYHNDLQQYCCNVGDFEVESTQFFIGSIRVSGAPLKAGSPVERSDKARYALWRNKLLEIPSGRHDLSHPNYWRAKWDEMESKLKQ